MSLAYSLLYHTRLTDLSVFSVEDYIPEALHPIFQSVKTAVVGTLATLGVVPQDMDTSAGTQKLTLVDISTLPFIAESAAARKANTDAASELATAELSLRTEETALTKLSNPEWFGKHGDWRKLENQCISKDTGEYTYTVCMFSGATQKSNKDGSSNNLGYVRVSRCNMSVSD